MALHAASRAGNVEEAKALLAADPDLIKAVDNLSRTALHLAAWAGHSRVVDVLLAAGAEVSAPAMDGITSLVCDAVLRMHGDEARVLLP